MENCNNLPILVQRELFFKYGTLRCLHNQDIAKYMMDMHMISPLHVVNISIYNNIPKTLMWTLKHFSEEHTYQGDNRFIRIVIDVIMRQQFNILKILFWNFRQHVFSLIKQILNKVAELYYGNYRYMTYNCYCYKFRQTIVSEFYYYVITLFYNIGVDMPWENFIYSVLFSERDTNTKLLKEKRLDHLVLLHYHDICNLQNISTELFATLARLNLEITTNMINTNIHNFAENRELFIDHADKICINKSDVLSGPLRQAINNEDMEYFECLVRHSTTFVIKPFLIELIVSHKWTMLEYIKKIYPSLHYICFTSFNKVYSPQIGVSNPHAHLILKYLIEFLSVDADVHEFMFLAIDADNMSVFKELLTYPISIQHLTQVIEFAQSINKPDYVKLLIDKLHTSSFVFKPLQLPITQYDL